MLHTWGCRLAADCERLEGERLAQLERDGQDSGAALAAKLARPASGAAPYRPGQLVAFLAETPHSVTPLTRGARRILFAFFSCRRPQAGPPRAAGEEAMPAPVSRWDA